MHKLLILHCISHADSFCQGIDDALLVPVIPRIAKAVGPFLTVTSEDTLSLVLESLSVIVEIDGGKWMTPDLANSLVVACLDVWMKNNKGAIHVGLLDCALTVP